MMIPKEKIEEVKDRASIVQVISEYIPLTKRGQNHIGLCPFHSEKSPSFTVSEEKRIFYCFGCNATGNVITFIMKKEGIEFPEAVRSLARKYGITIAEQRSGENDPREQLYNALKISSEYFYNELRVSDGKTARIYLKDRGLEKEIAQKFGVGYAPDKWSGLADYLKKKGISLDLADKAGLIKKKEKGYYDRFRARIIFPITDARGRTIGFGGRSIDNKDPKYLNSPESPVFKKGETLYGFFQAKDSIMKEGSAIIVEGYFDLIALHKNGFTNSVATMGTALTPEHIKALKGYAKVIYALFDSDEAGRNAALRGLNLFLNEEMPCRAVILPSGKDPDEFLKNSGPDALREVLNKAEPLLEFYLKDLQKKFDLTSPEGKRSFFNTAVSLILKVRNIAERDHYAAFLASFLRIPVTSVYEAIKTPSKEGESAGNSIRNPVNTNNSSLKELTILKVILKHAELYDDRVGAAIEAFSDTALKEAGRIISEFCRQGKMLNASTLIEGIKDDGIKARLAELLFKEEEGFIEDPQKMLEDCLKRVLNRGKIKPTTQEIINRLEELGKADIASDIKKRIGKDSGRGRH
ncbi:MAG: DNA primase [Deltaproteobacteria bacterium]|nr:DNA primase [Deltaproteobacteria bacterium]